ncbi:MAG TPA: hypothetical protein VEL76_06525, partial [Gemmataceae bacterium]|nr:hypothetical protein [Gemmataceae bacterium]
VTVGPGDPVCWWDVATGKPLRRFANNRYLGTNGGTLAIAGDGNTLFMRLPNDTSGWDLNSGERLYTRGSSLDPTPYTFYPGSPDGHTLLVVFPGDQKPIPQQNPPPPPGGQPPPPGRRPPPVIARYWSKIGLWDMRAGKLTRSFQVNAEYVQHLALSPDGLRVAGTGTVSAEPGQRSLLVWDLVRGLELRRLPMPPLDAWNGIAFARDGRSLISGPHTPQPGGKSTFYLWEVATGKERARVEYAFGVQYAPMTVIDDDRLAAVALESAICLIDPSTGRELHRLHGHEGHVTCLRFSPGGRLLASGSSDTTTLLWDLKGVRPEEKVRLSAKELAERWADLARDDAPKAYQAIQQLSKDPEQTTAWLAKQLRPAVGVAKDTIRRLLVDLDSKEFAVREKATRELLRHGEVAEFALRELLAGQPSLEVRRRAEGILAKLEERSIKPPPIPSGEALRQLRALEILERLGTPTARRILERLAQGALEAPLTREARAALRRLIKRAATP